MSEVMFWLDLLKEITHKLVYSMTKTELVLFLAVMLLIMAKAWILRFLVRILRELSDDVKRINGSVRDVSAAAEAAQVGLASHEKDDKRALDNINERIGNIHKDVREIRDRVWNYPAPREAT